MVKGGRSIWLLGWLTSLILTSCLNGAVYEENRAIKEAEWYSENPAVFEFEITDTLSTYNLIVNLRHGSTYPFANIYLFSQIELDSTILASDTLQYFLANKSGAWVGETGLGDMVENHLMFKPKYRFQQSGTYRVVLEQAMRENPLAPVYDVGFRVEKSK